VAALVLASAFLVGSGAVFTSSSANPSNVFTAGILTNTNNHSGSAILTASLMKPGDSQTGTVTISNTGNISGDFSVYAQKISSAPGTNGGDLYATLQLKIEDVTGTATTLWTGTMSSFSTLSLGNLATGASKSYRFTVTLPTTAPSGAMNSTTTETLTFTGVAQ
jgi:hypothetical protein